MKIYFRKIREKEYAFLKTSDKDIYLGPKDGVGRNEIENITKALEKTDGVFDLYFKKHEKTREYLLSRLGRAVASYAKDSNKE